METNTIIQNDLNKIAETQFNIRIHIEKSLKQFQINKEFQELLLNCDNYYDYWVKSQNDKFFDMGTYIRLGTSIENGLKKYYMDQKGHTNLVDLQNDPKYKQNIFQRIQPWTNDSAINLFKSELNLNLDSINNFKNLQIIMLNRHLYAHNSGLINEKYIRNLKILSNIDLMDDPNIKSDFPAYDFYYFKPLENLNRNIESVRDFFNKLTRI